MSLAVYKPTTEYGRKRMCERKRRYPSRHKAMTVARRMGWHAETYRCPCCGMYHLTHKRAS